MQNEKIVLKKGVGAHVLVARVRVTRVRIMTAAGRPTTSGDLEMTRKTTERRAKKDDGVIYNLVVGGEKVKVKRRCASTSKKRKG